MEQRQQQEQRLAQQLSQQQQLTQQQLLQVHLLELPINQLVERVNSELDDNPALEASSATDALSDDRDQEGEPTDEAADFDSQRERDDRQTALDEAFRRLGGDDDELPVYQPQTGAPDETAIGQDTSFYDLLRSQVGELSLTERERDIMDYLVGSLDDDGLLHKSLDAIADEMAVFQQIDASTKEIEGVLRKLQSLDPAGIGGRSLQECLTLQVERRADSRLKELMLTVLRDHFDDFAAKRWQRIASALSLSEQQSEALFGELRRLNPKPGASLSETVGRSVHQITPDVIVETGDDGTISFTLNNGSLPSLHVSEVFTDTLQRLGDSEGSSRQKREAAVYARSKVRAARDFIEAIRSSRRTLTLVVQAIIDIQRQFFLDGDEASIRPMILRDVEERTGYDPSTISRATSGKWVLTQWGTFPLKFLFGERFTGGNGDEQSSRRIKLALSEIVEHEDPNDPLTDDALTAALTARGFAVARRTVAKYREQLNIPVARLRRK